MSEYKWILAMHLGWRGAVIDSAWAIVAGSPQITVYFNIKN